jgi:hypothetical protein
MQTAHPDLVEWGRCPKTPLHLTNREGDKLTEEERISAEIKAEFGSPPQP